MKNWNSNDIKNWSKTSQKSKIMQNEGFLLEIVAAVKRAMFLHSKNEVRAIQMFALLIMLNNNNNGRIA